MKKLTLLNLLIVPALLLTGCAKNIDKEAFLEKLADVKENVVVTNSDIKNVHIHNGLNVTTYDYKEGEYYAYHTFVIIIIIPYKSEEFIYKNNDKYYQINTYTDSSKDTKKEITQDEFNLLMLARKQKIIDELNDPISAIDRLIDEEDDEYKSIKNSFSAGGNTLNFTSNVVKETYDSEKEENKDIKGKINISFKNNLPTKYETKVDGNTVWSYSYGNATLKIPSNFQD